MIKKEGEFMKTYIIVKFQFEGFHFWKDAPMEVDFLKKPHRHIFYCEVKLPVTHDDRQLEFFMVKKALQIAVKDIYNFDLGGKSCEMICEDIITAVQSKYGLNKDITVSVFEDGENGAMVAT